ncbi:MAG TPA: cobalamin biosynthesis protein CobW [Porticoccaceae bacterium]|nr:cobalamin biosynthesis protein CobW [Porticoccaceae bacterium]
MSLLKAIPTNVITGFLGVGKSTAILNLLKNKPDDERWAVLVNEFGEVGIDGSLFSGNESEELGMFIREVPGGCMCCAAGLPMQVALNLLLASARPHRLLIEPTGLGHPKEVLAVLTSEYYREVLDLRATVTLVDARKVHDERYIHHPSFNQQLAIADVIVANKSDQYQSGDFPALLDFLESTPEFNNTPVFQVSQGALQSNWLSVATSYRDNSHTHHHKQEDFPALLETPDIPSTGYLSIKNEGEGFYSQGWIFTPEWVFDSDKLFLLLSGIEAERIKGVFSTSRGVIAYNMADSSLTTITLKDCSDSRIECISSEKYSLESLEEKLLSCVIKQ